jgi:hypothetical protein
MGNTREDVSGTAERQRGEVEFPDQCVYLLVCCHLSQTLLLADFRRFAPVTIIAGVYGMNVSEISGSDSNPRIWQFFVAVLVFNILMLLGLSISNWIRVQIKHGRTAGLKETFAFAVGTPNAS